MKRVLREARLRPEFAQLYPGIEPGLWEEALLLADLVLAQHLLQPSPGFMLSDRVLPDSHFEFRGSAPRPDGRPPMQSRRTDLAL